MGSHQWKVAENRFARFLIDEFGVDRRFTPSDLDGAYAAKWSVRVLSFGPHRRQWIADQLRLAVHWRHLVEETGPKGGKGWRIQPSMMPKSVYEFLPESGERLRSLGAYLPLDPPNAMVRAARAAARQNRMADEAEAAVSAERQDVLEDAYAAGEFEGI